MHILWLVVFACLALVSCKPDGGTASTGAENSNDVYRAHGTEPFWGIFFDKDAITVDIMDSGKHSYSRAMPVINDGARLYDLGGEGRIKVAPAAAGNLCSDGMSDHLYPDHVTLTWQGQAFKGCGGMPVSALTADETASGKTPDIVGTIWILAEIDGHAPAGERIPTVSFSEDGTLSGHGGCNRFSAPYRLDGEDLKIEENMISTMMACADMAMNDQERIYTGELVTMTSARIENGKLRLSNDQGKTLVFVAR